MARSSQALATRASWREKLAVAGLMSLLSLAMTWPLALNLSSSINDYGDPLLNSWILWWVVRALVTPGLSLFNAPIFFPEPLTLAYSEHLLVSAATVSPVLLLGGDPILAHNLIFLLALTVAGLGAYLLGLELTGSRGAALIMALGFAFSPFRFGHLGHLQMQTNHFMPFVLLYLHRWAKSPRWSLALLFGLFWLLQILSCGYYALFISLAVGLFMLFYGLRGRWWGDLLRIRQMATVTLGVALLVAPLYLPYMQVKKEMGFKRAESLAAGFSAEPRHYLAAPPANLLYGRGTQEFRASEGELFLGLGLSGLVLIGLLRRREGASAGRPAGLALGLTAAGGLAAGLSLLTGGFGLPPGGAAGLLGQPLVWLGLALAALCWWRVASLGGLRPAWQAGPRRWLGWPPPGQRLGSHLDPNQVFYLLLALVAFWASLGPEYGLYDALYRLVPGFEALRVPARLAVLVGLAWAVLAGFGWQRLAAYWEGRPRLSRAALAGLSLFVLLEACSVPLPWLTIYDETPEVYQWLAQQPAGTVVMELPTYGFHGDNARDARYLYWSTKHHQTLVNGYSGFFSQAYLELANKAAKVGRSDFLEELARRGARYLIIHGKEYPGGDRDWLLGKLGKNPGLRLAFHTQWDYVYELLPLARPGS